MAEYIEREAAKKEFALNFGSVSHAVIANRLLDSIPAADVAPVVHGRWIEDEEDEEIVCSNCGTRIPEMYSNADSILRSECHFCHNCGAGMDGE
jgi:hypothetical protein